MSQLSQPPSHPVRLRRRPQNRRASPEVAQVNSVDTSTEMSRVKSFTTSALAIGAGGDLTALAPRGQRMRVLWKEDAARIVAIFVVLVAVVVVAMTLMQSPQAGYAHSASKAQSISEERPVPEKQSAPEKQPAPEEQPATNESRITVYVSGEVAHPGVLELPAQSRVNDAVTAAGGLTPNADQVRINLAAVITDGEHIHVLARDEEESVAPASAASNESKESAQININTANEQQLQAIPGVGPSTATAIVHWRETHGKFNSVEELVEVSGIGPKTLERLRPYVRV